MAVFILGGLLFMHFFHQAHANNHISKTEKLFLTAKVWGYLKYYHPQVASGKYDWDNVLLDWIKQIEKRETPIELSNFLLQSIEDLGEIKPCKKCHVQDKKKEYFLENFNLDWIKNNDNLTAELKEVLLFVENNRYQGKQYYVTPDYAGHVKFTNEPDYSSSHWNRPEFRLLQLIKFWNAVEYFYPYKYLTDQNWDEVLMEMIPRFIEVSTEVEFHLLIRELTIKLDDSHAFFKSDLVAESFGNMQFPFRYKFIDKQLIITEIIDDSLAHLNDYKVGDIILAIDGEKIWDRYQKTRKYYNGSNEITKKRYSFIGLLRGQASEVKMTYERDGSITDKVAHRYNRTDITYQNTPTILWKKLTDDIAYVDVSSLEKGDVPVVMSKVMPMKSIIFDLRGYPDFILYDLAKYLMPEPREFYRAMRPYYNYPGKFYWGNVVTCGKKNKHPYQGQVIILVNEHTQSLAEFTAMSLQVADNSISVGHQTSAANGDVSTFTFFGEYTT